MKRYDTVPLAHGPLVCHARDIAALCEWHAAWLYPRAMRTIAYASILWVTVCLLLPACEASPEGTRQSVIHDERDSFAFDGPPARVYRLAQELVAEKGFVLPDDADPIDRSISTNWKPGTLDSEQQFIVRFIGLKNDRFLVHLIGVSRDRDGNIYHRDRSADLEWELIQRAAPDRALDIATRANHRADAVRQRNNRRR